MTLDDLTDLPATLTVEEAAEILRIGRSAAYDAVRRGEIPSVKLGRRILVPTARLLAMIGVEPDRNGADDGPFALVSGTASDQASGGQADP